ncbi:MAG TPA: (d)CMP kinase [Chitinophagales bacterium]|nr:(d)CMP kinase [Chitinophagales bacterium]
MSQDIIIAIDGFASSGKSTIAKQLAAALHYKYVDSGAFYRAVTLYFLNNSIDWKIDVEVRKALREIAVEFRSEGNQSKTFLNGVNVEGKIRSMEVSEAVSEVSTLPAVRNFISQLLRIYATSKKIVMDGRDIGTVVFPNAELKVFLTAEQKIRSDRRYNEMKEKGIPVTENQISQNLSGRDLTDSTRTTAPLKKADDAITLDNTHLSIDEQFNIILKLAREKMA